MNVIHLITDLNPMGGAERLVGELCKGAVRFKPFVLAIYGAHGEIVDELRSEGISIGCLKSRLDIHGLLRAATDWGLRPNDTVYHAHLFPSLYLGAIQRRLRSIYTEHSTDNRRRHMRPLRRVERLVYRRYDALTAISSAARESLQKWIGASAEISVVENGIDLARFAGCGVRSGETRVSSEFFYFGMSGRMSAAKNQDLLISALKDLPDRFRLRLAGDGVRRAQLEELARTLEVRDRVEFLGYVADIRTFLAQLDLYVQASHYEGFGLAPLEAMASGVPVLGSRLPGLQDVLGCEESLFETRQLVPLISRVAAEPEFRDRLRQHGLAQAQKFSIEATVRSYENLYGQVLGRRR